MIHDVNNRKRLPCANQYEDDVDMIDVEDDTLVEHVNEEVVNEEGEYRLSVEDFFIWFLVLDVVDEFPF
jgi:cell fate regulator YaaT (PSP1 superfamily)